VEVVLTDRMLRYIETGQRAEVFSENSPAGLVAAPISRISPFLHPVTHSTDAEIELANPDGHLKSGMFVTVDVYYGESEQATLLPLSALYENPTTGGTGVYVCQDSLRVEPAGAMSDGQSVSLSNPARVRPVRWEWVEQLQNLQREDLLQEVLKRQHETGSDTAHSE
jgi:multidrug efflux pump subunit AcrA (membrane-fusion protein)